MSRSVMNATTPLVYLKNLLLFHNPCLLSRVTTYIVEDKDWKLNIREQGESVALRRCQRTTSSRSRV